MHWSWRLLWKKTGALTRPEHLIPSLLVELTHLNQNYAAEATWLPPESDWFGPTLRSSRRNSGSPCCGDTEGPWSAWRERCVVPTAAMPGRSTDAPLRCLPTSSRGWASPSSLILCEQAPQPGQKNRKVFWEEKVLISDIRRERKTTSNQSLEEWETTRAHLSSVDYLLMEAVFWRPQPGLGTLSAVFQCACAYLSVLAELLVADHRILPELKLFIREESRADAAKVSQQAGQLFLQTTTTLAD